MNQASHALLLSEAINGRDNALDALRLAAAVMVMVSHSWPITGGPGTLEPLQSATGYTLGTFAVMIFFGLSGFLITLSYLRAPNLRRFAERRARRILPGLLTCVLLSAFVLGPFVTELSLGSYLSAWGTWSFVLINGSLLGFEPQLPGVYQSNPYPAAAGSLWTLTHEVACYAGIACLGAVGFLGRRTTATYAVGLGLCLAVLLPQSGFALPGRMMLFLDLAVPFAIGSLFCLWRDRVRLSLRVLVLMIAAAALLQGTHGYHAAFALALVYGAFVVGFQPSLSWLTRWLRVDYSYGVYIYAFPVQGLTVALMGPTSPFANLVISLPATFLLAALSWHLVEKPWLGSSSKRRRDLSPKHDRATQPLPPVQSA